MNSAIFRDYAHENGIENYEKESFEPKSISKTQKLLEDLKTKKKKKF